MGGFYQCWANLMFFLNLPGLGFISFYKTHYDSLIHFEIIYQETWAWFQNFEKNIFAWVSKYWVSHILDMPIFKGGFCKWALRGCNLDNH
jgi:hypothetical protein